MAPRVGQALREARTQRGIALNDVERVTGIRVQYLRALEDGRWDQLPEPGQADELISTYARYLGLDEQALLEDYERSRQRRSRAAPVPTRVLRPAGASRDRSSRRPFVLIGAGAVAVLLLGLLLVAALGSSGGGDEGDGNDGQGRTAPAAEERGGAGTSTSTTAATSTSANEVSVELSATADVWVCLVNADGSQPVNGETLTTGEERGPFTSRRFEMTLGNGSIEMTVEGDRVKVPALAEPLGLRVTPDGAKRLDAGSGPTCA